MAEEQFGLPGTMHNRRIENQNEVILSLCLKSTSQNSHQYSE